MTILRSEALAEAYAKAYLAKFGFQIRGRLATLLHRYPDVTEPNFISWEGAELTGADTTEKIRNLMKDTPWL
jgi:hypothetical protein